jgi:hypothetical protein
MADRDRSRRPYEVEGPEGSDASVLIPPDGAQPVRRRTECGWQCLLMLLFLGLVVGPYPVLGWGLLAMLAWWGLCFVVCGVTQLYYKAWAMNQDEY